MIITIKETEWNTKALLCNPKGIVAWYDVATTLCGMGYELRAINFVDGSCDYTVIKDDGTKTLCIPSIDFIALNNHEIIECEVRDW